MLGPLCGQLPLVLELHARTAQAVVVAIVMVCILFEAKPAELEFAFFASHVVAARLLFDGGLAVGALPLYSTMYLILKDR